MTPFTYIAPWRFTLYYVIKKLFPDGLSIPDIVLTLIPIIKRLPVVTRPPFHRRYVVVFLFGTTADCVCQDHYCGYYGDVLPDDIDYH